MIWTLLLSGALADSPLTSTPFYEVYRDVPAVAKADSSHQLDDELCRFISNPEIPIDHRAAVINALGWNFDGQKNALVFREFLSRKYRVSAEKVDKKLTPDESFAMGYLLALDDYFNPEPGVPYLQKARKKMSRSYTVAMVTGLVEAQAAFDSSWCQMWQFYATAELRFPEEKRDLRPAAHSIVEDYMRLYSGECANK